MYYGQCKAFQNQNQAAQLHFMKLIYGIRYYNIVATVSVYFHNYSYIRIYIILNSNDNASLSTHEKFFSSQSTIQISFFREGKVPTQITRKISLETMENFLRK